MPQVRLLKERYAETEENIGGSPESGTWYRLRAAVLVRVRFDTGLLFVIF